MKRELGAEARRRGATKVEVIREALARELGRTQARDEITELRRALTESASAVTHAIDENTSEIARVHRDLRHLLQRLPPAQ